MPHLPGRPGFESEISGLAARRQTPGERAGDQSGHRLQANQEAQYAVFLEAPVPLFLLERDGTVLRANRRAGRLLGFPPGYATGKPFTALVDLPARAAVHAHLAASRRTGEARQIR